MKNLLTTLFFLIIFLGFPGLLFAKVSFSIELPTSIAKNEEVLAELKIHTGADSVNAISGEIKLPPEIQVSEIYTGKSTVIFWIEKPIISPLTHTITFSGLTPGGITGDRSVFSFAMKSDTSGKYTLIVSNPTALKNDGKGTSLPVEQSRSQVTVSSKNLPSTASFGDTIPPEQFTPVIVSTPDLFNNKSFVSFATQDKGVGIDHYEYADTLWGKPGKDEWKPAESPFELPPRASIKKIYIKAVDKKGNETITAISGKLYYANISLWVILTAIVIICTPHIRKRFS